MTAVDTVNAILRERPELRPQLEGHTAGQNGLRHPARLDRLRHEREQLEAWPP